MELLRTLIGQRHPAVLACQHHLGSPVAALRAAAEEGMASLFGPNWNRTRAIPPVQPPRSDDGGRGHEPDGSSAQAVTSLDALRGRATKSS